MASDSKETCSRAHRSRQAKRLVTQSQGSDHAQRSLGPKLARTRAPCVHRPHESGGSSVSPWAHAVAFICLLPVRKCKQRRLRVSKSVASSMLYELHTSACVHNSTLPLADSTTQAEFSKLRANFGSRMPNFAVLPSPPCKGLRFAFVGSQLLGAWSKSAPRLVVFCQQKCPNCERPYLQPRIYSDQQVTTAGTQGSTPKKNLRGPNKSPGRAETVNTN